MPAGVGGVVAEAALRRLGERVAARVHHRGAGNAVQSVVAVTGAVALEPVLHSDVEMPD
jgi:hypothetical protein